MAAVTALLTVPEARVFLAALGAHADAIPDDPEDLRTRGQKMADCLLDLVLRPGETDRATVQVLLTVVASVGTLAGGDEPGEIDGHVVPAEMVRELLRVLGPGAESEPAAAIPEATEPASSSSPPWQEVEQEELERWWSEVERRVLAEELGTGPEPLVDDEVLVRMLSEAAQEQSGHEFFDGEFFDGEVVDHDPQGRERLDCDPPDCDPPDHDPPDHDPPHREPADAAEVDAGADGRTRGPVERGWWMAADRAVDAAAQVLLGVDQSLARARWLVRKAVAADGADESAWQETQGRFNAADDALAVLRACTENERERLGELLMATGGGGLAERPRIALTDAVSGALLALTDLPTMRRVGTCGARRCRRDPARCVHDLSGRPGLGPPGPTDGYRPSAPLDRWVRARDRRCRFPGCRRRVPRGGELDHDRPYPLGPTSAANLAGYCTGHHRGKHQAPGWRHALAPDGTLTVTTPTGLTAVTTPAPY